LLQRAALDPAAYAGVRTFAALLNTVGLEAAVASLRPIGAAYGRTPLAQKRIRRASEYIAWAFPEWSEARVRAATADSFRYLFALAAELACAPRMGIVGDGRQLPPRVELGETLGAIDLLLSGRPCVMITAHCGNWEMVGATVASIGVKVAALYRPLNQKPVDDWVRRTRAARGLDLIDKFGATERIAEVTSRGGSIGFTADQNAGRKGVFVPFFDRFASSYKSIGLLAIEREMPLVCGQARRLGGPDAATMNYRLEVTDVIYPEDWKDQPDKLFYVTARYRRAIELMIRKAPDQYLWLHGAWKTRAPHERRGKPIPESLVEKCRSLPWMTEDRLERLIERSNRDAAEAAGT
jgi:KDO2-lipid IV(A) lauroyltransferase